MRLSGEIFRSSTALLMGNAANKVAGFFVMVIMARYLGPEDFGLYTLVFSWVWLFSTPTDLGLTPIVGRELSQDPDRGRLALGDSVLVRAAVSVLMYLGAVLTGVGAYGFSARSGLVALAATAILLTPLSSAMAVLTARLKLYRAAAAHLISRVILLAAVGGLAVTGAGLPAFIGVEVGLGLAVAIFLWMDARRLVRPEYRLSPGAIRRLVGEGIPLALSAAFISFYFRIDVFVIEFFHGSEAVGTYAGAYRLVEAVPLLATSLTVSTYPALCRLIATGDQHGLERLVRGSQKVLLAMAVPVSLIVAVYAGWIVDLLYNASFVETPLALIILVCGQALVFSNILSSSILTASGKGRRLMLVTMGMAGLNLVLNLLVVPRFGVPGAAATTLATEAAGMVTLAYGTGTLGWFVRDGVRVMGAGALLGVVIVLAGRFGIVGVWPVVPGALLFAVGLRVFGVFDADEWLRLKRLIRPEAGYES